jgi:hypothetical protein
MIQITFATMEGCSLINLIKRAKENPLYELGASLLSCVLYENIAQCDNMYKYKAQLEQNKYNHIERSESENDSCEGYNYACGYID